MIKTPSILVLTMLTITVASSACNRSEPQGEAPAADTAATATSPLVPPRRTDEPSPATPEAAGEVVYKPAYPDDVSTQGLTEEDVAQQEAGHSHGDGEEHNHDDGEEHIQDDGSHSHDAADHGEDETHDSQEHDH